MSTQTPNPPSATEDVLGSEKQTKKVLSSLRLKVAFMLFVSALLLGLCGMIFALVSHIFGALTPAIRADLQWKAEHGAAELRVGRARVRAAVRFADRRATKPDEAGPPADTFAAMPPADTMVAWRPPPARRDVCP